MFSSYYLALAAASSPLGVIAGSLAGHGVATLVTSFSAIDASSKYGDLFFESNNKCII